MSRVKFKSNAKSSRELRRMAQREQTREQRQAAIDAFWKLSPEERAQRIADNEARESAKTASPSRICTRPRKMPIPRV